MRLCHSRFIILEIPDTFLSLQHTAAITVSRSKVNIKVIAQQIVKTLLVLTFHFHSLITNSQATEDFMKRIDSRAFKPPYLNCMTGSQKA